MTITTKPNDATSNATDSRYDVHELTKPAFQFWKEKDDAAQKAKKLQQPNRKTTNEAKPNKQSTPHAIWSNAEKSQQSHSSNQKDENQKHKDHGYRLQRCSITRN